MKLNFEQKFLLTVGSASILAAVLAPICIINNNVRPGSELELLFAGAISSITGCMIFHEFFKQIRNKPKEH